MTMKNLLLIVFAIAFGTCTYAQTNFSNSGNLRVHSGANLRVNGSITNNSGSQLLNNGTLQVSGNIHNNETGMTQGTGTWILNGTSTQNITGAAPLVVNNITTSNSSGINVSNNISIHGVHAFTSGVISTSSTPNYVIYENGSSYSGNGDSRHINGWARKNGSGNFVFPIGNGIIQRTIEITDLSANSAFVAKYNAPTPNTWNVMGPLVSLDLAEYWQLDQVSGGTAKVSMNWNHSKVAFPNWVVSEVRVAEYVAGMWADQGGSATGTTTSTGSITSNQLSTFGSFTFASTSVILPVDLLFFDAVRSNHRTNISWKTANETGVDRFEIQRSNDGASFYSISQHAARNSGAIEFYTAVDDAVINNEAYYRLKSVDQDGAVKLSRIVKVRDEIGKSGFQLMKNPVTNILSLKSLSVNGAVDFTIFAASGNTIQRGTINVSADANFNIPLKGYFIPGIYTLQLINAGNASSIRFVVQ